MSNDDKLEPTDAPLPFDGPSPATDAPAARCESCGRPAEGDDLCVACRFAFQGVLQQFDEAAAPVPAPTMAPPEPPANEPKSADAIEALFDQLASTLPPPAVVEQSSAAEPPPVAEPFVFRSVEAPVVPKETAIDEHPAIIVLPTIVETPAPPPASVAAEEPEAASVDAVEPKGAPVVEPAAAHVPVRPRRGLRALGALATAAIVVATIGIPLSKLWLSKQKIVIVQQPAPAAAPANAPEKAAPKPEKPVAKKEPVVAAAPKVETPLAPPRTLRPTPRPTPPRPAPTATPTTTPTTAPSTALKPPRPAVAPAQPIVAPPVLAVNAPPEASLPIAEPVTIAAPPPPPPATVMGPFFESRDVDRAPQATSRVEPNLPDDMDQTRHEILIVRVLVSQAGEPTLVSLLRRSKSGSKIDAAVVNAVKQWSFSPAIRRGETVSCFLNVAVPVGSKP